MRFRLPSQRVSDTSQQRNNDAIQDVLNTILDGLTSGVGAPTHSPSAPQIYLDRTGIAGAAVYAWNMTSWVVVA